MTDDAPSPPLMRRAYKFRLVPTEDQAQALKHTLDVCRRVYNAAVEQRYRYLDQRRIDASGHWQRLTWYDQKREIKDFRPALADEGLMDVPSIVLQDVLQRVHRAFERWRTVDASGRRFGPPRYQSWKHYDSWTYAMLGNGVSLRDHDPYAPLSARMRIQPNQRGDDLNLFHVGHVAVRWHHQQPGAPHGHPMRGTIKTVTIKREADGWYVIFSCDAVPARPLPPTDQTTALDVRVASFATLADGTEIGNPRYYQKAQRKLRLAQRRLDRRKPKPGQRASKGYEKARALLAKAHQRVARQRHDFHHAIARDLVRRYDSISREDLPIKTLLELREEEMPPDVRRARNLGMADSGWGQFFQILNAKAEEAGRTVVAVNPAYTTRTCSQCGFVLGEPVMGREFACPGCGHRMGKAHNAALNVLRAGQAQAAEQARDSRERTGDATTRSARSSQDQR